MSANTAIHAGIAGNRQHQKDRLDSQGHKDVLPQHGMGSPGWVPEVLGCAAGRRS